MGIVFLSFVLIFIVILVVLFKINDSDTYKRDLNKEKKDNFNFEKHEEKDNFNFEKHEEIFYNKQQDKVYFDEDLLNKIANGDDDEYTEKCIQTTFLGNYGERKEKRVIGETIEDKQYVINNIIIGKDEKTCQIDHIVINEYGVFVIETKNYSGAIFGEEDQDEWEQLVGFDTNKIKNPLKQNEAHIYYLKQIVENVPIFNLVVLVQNNPGTVNSQNVVSLYELKNRLSKGEKVLSADKMKEIYEKIVENKSDATLQEHVRNIRQQKVSVEVCPKCGGRLVLRKGKYGEFWGCSNYPKCKFIKNK